MPAPHARFWFAVVLALGLGAPSPGAAAGAASAGERAYARADYVLAAKLLASPAENGDAKAQTYLGFMYANGFGVPQDYELSAKWLTLAAEQGEPTAQYLLGGLYDRGLGAPHDFVLAEIWLDLASAGASRENRDLWTGMRDAVASKLTRAQQAEAQRRARAWVPQAAP